MGTVAWLCHLLRQGMCQAVNSFLQAGQSAGHQSAGYPSRTLSANGTPGAEGGRALAWGGTLTVAELLPLSQASRPGVSETWTDGNIWERDSSTEVQPDRPFASTAPWATACHGPGLGSASEGSRREGSSLPASFHEPRPQQCLWFHI